MSSNTRWTASARIGGRFELELVDEFTRIRTLTLIDEVERYGGVTNPVWTFGGGTVLMLRYRHRLSKDIDIFVPDPQYLGFVSPRLSDYAESISTDYVEGPGYIKLFRPEGEIDFVVSTNLTESPHEEWNLFGHKVNVETASEIVAKNCFTADTGQLPGTCSTLPR